MSKPHQASIEAAKAVHVYLVKEDMYLDERQFEQVALAIESEVQSLLIEARRVLTNACQLIDGFKNDPSLAPGEWSVFDEMTRREVGEILAKISPP